MRRQNQEELNPAILEDSYFIFLRRNWGFYTFLKEQKNARREAIIQRKKPLWIQKNILNRYIINLLLYETI
jgi:hypothetical protein